MGVPFEDVAPQVAATVIVITIFALIVFPLRLWIRLSNRSWGWDDWSMCVAAVPFAALTVFCLGGSFQGIGVHASKLTADQISTALLWFFGFEVFFCLTIIPLKLSISFMLIRISGHKKGYIWALGIISAMFVIMNVVSLFYIIFQCQPVSYAWNTNQDGHCNRSQILADIYYADTAINIFTDWFCALIPIPLLWNVQMNRNSKISVGFLLSLGVLASLSACIRLKFTVNLNNSTDYPFSIGDIVIWGYAENGVGLVVGCMSTLRPLVQRIFHLGSTQGASKLADTPGGSGFGDWGSRSGLPVYSGPVNTKARTTVSRGQGQRKRSSSGSESEEYILQNFPNKQMNGIQVDTRVEQSRD